MSRLLRFCMITTFYPPYSFGGDAIYVQQLSNELAKRGHQVEVIHCLDSYRLLEQGESPRETNDHPKVIVHRLESDWGMLSPLATQQTGYPFFKAKALGRILARGFDVIHYHNISLVGGPKVLEIGEAVKLYTTHEYWLVCPMSVLLRYDGVACKEKRCLRCTLAYHRPPQWWRYGNLLKDSMRHVDMILYPSTFSQEKHRELGLDAPGTVLRYFHTPSEGLRNLPRTDSTIPYFLFVGRFEKLKGAHTLIPLFRDYPRARLVMVGEGSQGTELREMAGDSLNIEFRGWLNHAELAPLYHNATALIVPSLCYENGPLVTLEAFSFRTPTLGRSIGTLPELLEGTGGGLVYQDDASLRAAMDELLDNPARRHQLGENGYAAYCQTFTAEAHLKRYFEIIEEMLAGRGTDGSST